MVQVIFRSPVSMAIAYTLLLAHCRDREAPVPAPESITAQSGNSGFCPSKGGSPSDNRSDGGGLKGSSDAVPAGFKGFCASGDYPATPEPVTGAPPEPDLTVLRKNDAPAKQEALRWLKALQQYFYEGMADQDASDINNNFRVGSIGPNFISQKRWYHMPWLHTPDSAESPGRGRDGIWGLTRELDLKCPIAKGQWPVVTGSQCIGQDWGIGFFNEPGGYAIGKLFPVGSKTDTRSFRFPKGTVSFKMLFTSASTSDVDDISGALEIDAYVNGGGSCSNANGARKLTKMRHVQMDVMMRYGDGADQWIFGVFVYDRSKRDANWNGMTPLGVQFGVKRDETIIVSDSFRANGHEGRLNGPADNPMSSCFSCHARAQWPEVSTSRLPFAPRETSDRSMICLLHDWGGEEKCNETSCKSKGGCMPAGTAPLVPGNDSADYSLQVPLALRNRAR